MYIGLNCKKKISGKKCLEKVLLDRGRGCSTTKGKCANLCLFPNKIHKVSILINAQNRQRRMDPDR